MNNISDVDESRRQFLIYLLSTGALTTIAGCGTSGPDSSGMPGEMPTGRSIFKYSGDVRVNGQPVSVETLIKVGDVVETFDESYIIFVVNKDS